MRVYIDNSTTRLLGEEKDLPFSVVIEFGKEGKVFSAHSLSDIPAARGQQQDRPEIDIAPEGSELFAYLNWGDRSGRFSISNFDLNSIEAIGFIPLGNHVSVRVQHPATLSGCVVTCDQTGTTANNCAICESSSGLKFEVCC